MASSKKLPKSSSTTSQHALLLRDLRFLLRDLFRNQKLTRPSLLVAYSGGLDSTVLLHALYQIQKKLPFHLRAMHVHHGLSDYADSWESLCQKTCDSLGITFESVHVSVDKKSGLGIEAFARNARYQALNKTSVDFICLGHHQDDQAETLLLQLARGAGVRGLAGMAQVDKGRRLLRPLLTVRRDALLAYAKHDQLEWVEDESNVDTTFDRNHMRHVIIPALGEKYTSITQTLSRSATHMADASFLLDDLATLDAETVLDQTQQYGALKLNALHALTGVRQANLVRWWIANNQISMPSTALLQQILKQLNSARSDASVKVKVADGLCVARYKNLAYLIRETSALSAINLLWQGEERIVLPNLSRLLFTTKLGEGIAYQRGGTDIKLRIKNREGGERFKPELGRPRRSLKYVMQSSEIPPWCREQMPLIFMDETLVFIPNIGVDADMKATNQEMGLSVSWEPAVD